MDRTVVSGSPFSQNSAKNSAKHGLGAAKQGLGAAKHCIVMEKARKTLQNGMGKTVFGPHRRERIGFLAEFGEAGPWCSKAGPRRSKAW